MPKPIELALSQIWNRKSIECLNATQLGAFIALARANLVHGVDPLPSDRDSLQRLSRTSRIQWASCFDRVAEALRDALPVLTASYRYKQQLSDNLAARINVARAVREKNVALALSLKPKLDVAFSDADEYAAGVIQPHVAAPYIAKNYDTRARNAAIKQQETGAKPALTD